MALDPNKVVRKLRQSPQKVVFSGFHKTLDAARRGSLVELMELANCWQEVPDLLNRGVLDVFFLHLDASKTPTTPDRATNSSPDADRAFMALLGVSRADNLLNDGNRKEYAGVMIKAWPGIFTWSAFFFEARVQASGIQKEIRRSAMDVISSCWYTISRDDNVCAVIGSTTGSIEIATKLWVLEDDGPIPSTINLPVASVALYSLLKAGDVSLLDRVVTTCGGKPEPVVHLALTRLRSEIKKHQVDGIRTAVFIDLINRLSRPQIHPLRTGFLNGHVIQVITKALAAVATQLNATGNPTLLEPMVAGFGYLWNCLDSTDGVTWILQSIRAGVLTAFVEGSPHFNQLDPEDLEMVLGVIKSVFPRYLVYRTIIKAVDGAMLKIQASPYKPTVLNGVAGDVWRDFRKLSLERLMVTFQVTAAKGKGVTCDNVKCQKIDAKDNFQKCSRCLTTYYCSRSCQQVSWKEGDHKTMCKMKRSKRCGAQSKIGSFITTLQHGMPATTFPFCVAWQLGISPLPPFSGLMIQIDYTQVPEKYSVKPIAKHDHSISQFAYAEARTDALIEKAMDNPGKYTLIESMISSGENCSLVLTMNTGTFWNGDADLVSESEGLGGVEGELDEESRDLDREAELTMGRKLLDDLLKSLGHGGQV